MGSKPRVSPHDFKTHRAVCFKWLPDFDGWNILSRWQRHAAMLTRAPRLRQPQNEPPSPQSKRPGGRKAIWSRGLECSNSL